MIYYVIIICIVFQTAFIYLKWIFFFKLHCKEEKELFSELKNNQKLSWSHDRQSIRRVSFNLKVLLGTSINVVLFFLTPTPIDAKQNAIQNLVQ